MAHSYNETPPADRAPERCPLCGGPNECQLCTTAAYKGPCWCMTANIPEALLAQVPEASRNKACICKECVQRYQQSAMHTNPPANALSEAHYFENGLMVFTETYLLRRGYCCDNNCRHCPYRAEPATP